MTLSKLSIFSKNTDANQSLKGYEYQKLRTLENWLYNKVNNVDELIFCEYEDDIFARNIEQGTSKFTQIKLYGSKPFSFKSEEVTKAIINFFMIFVKEDYKDDSVSFVFETNTGIAKKNKDNDAKLLKDWFENQGNFDNINIEKYILKVKTIISNHINAVFEKLDKKNKPKAKSAKNEFDNLPDSVWEDFTKSIKWEFNNDTPDLAIEKIVNSIYDSISRLPFPSMDGMQKTVFTSLYYEVSHKLFQNEPENRCLSNNKLDALILNLGNDADKQYILAYELWSPTVKIELFILSHFLEVIDSSYLCRQSPYLEHHSEFWLKLLNFYITLDEIPERYKQKAIYEYLWLSLRPSLFNKPTGNLIGLNHLIERYFLKLKNYQDHESLEDHLNLSQIIRASILMNKSDFPLEVTQVWLEEIKEIFDYKILTSENPSIKCYYLEIKASFLTITPNKGMKTRDTDEILDVYNMLIELLPYSDFYNVSRLSERINLSIKGLLQFKTLTTLINVLEDVSEKLIPIVSERNGKNVSAKIYYDKAQNYLNYNDVRNNLKALSFLHKAKDLWLQNETGDKYVLRLLEIAEIYSSLKMNLAAKYYAISALWYCLNNNPHEFLNTITTCYGFLVHYEFKQGAWFNSLDYFSYFIRSKFYLGDSTINTEDSTLMRALANIAGILSFGPKISTQTSFYINFRKSEMGNTLSEILNPMIEECEHIYTKNTLNSEIIDHLDSSPINDIGQKRNIEFGALGSSWTITFSNSWINASLVEEFSAILQITIVELASLDIDLHLIKTKVNIEVIEKSKWSPPEQLPSHHDFSWIFYTLKIDSQDTQVVNLFSGQMIASIKILFQAMSLLPLAEYDSYFSSFFINKGLAEKTRSIQLYQIILRKLFPEDLFIESKRDFFDSSKPLSNIKESYLLSYQVALSNMYNREQSVSQITTRYNMFKKNIQLTVQNLKKDPEYKNWLKGLKSEGWVDWQILSAIFNHICNYKINKILKNEKYETEELRKSAYDREAEKIINSDESENYINFPLSFFQNTEFNFYLNNTLVLASMFWGLDLRTKFHNFPAIKELLIEKFNLEIDDVPELSIL